MSGTRVQDHYARTDIVERALAALRAVNGADTPITPERLAPIDHFHGRGVLATEELARRLDPHATDHILDIGCGIGGPGKVDCSHLRMPGDRHRSHARILCRRHAN